MGLGFGVRGFGGSLAQLLPVCARVRGVRFQSLGFGVRGWIWGICYRIWDLWVRIWTDRKRGGSIAPRQRGGVQDCGGWCETRPAATPPLELRSTCPISALPGVTPHSVQGAGFRVQGSGFRVQDTTYGLRLNGARLIQYLYIVYRQIF